jgi:23S rRNA-/tRNA-specific pseudouridylate synthase
MLVAFGDESGTPHPASGERFFIVALLVVQNPRRIEELVRRTRRSLRRRARTSELKAARSHPRVIRRFLTKLTTIECEIVTLR